MSTTKIYNVYVLESINKKGTFYVGMAIDIERRLEEHNRGKSKFTKAFMPWKIIYQEKVGNAIEARKIEKYYKSTAGKNRLRKLGIID